MKNTTHYNESRDDRLKRFQDNTYIESIETLLSSTGNHLNNEIRVAAQNYQTSLLFMGIHASALTLSEVFFNKKDLVGYKLFAQKYIDGEAESTRFSLIAETIHSWRNVLAHQWISSIGHTIAYDYEMEHGWKDRESTVVINPRIYCDQYLKAFAAGHGLWRYRRDFTPEQLEQVKQRIINKYANR